MGMGKIYVPQCAGQMCNNIYYFVQALATALDCNRDLVYFFGKAIRSFSDLHPEALDGIRVFCSNRRPNKFVDGACGIIQNAYPGKGKAYFRSNVERVNRFVGRPRCMPIVLWNWYFNNHEGMCRHRETICAYLKAKEPFVCRARRIVDRARQQSEIVVGLHVRRGDYRMVWNGRCYYDDFEYLRFMREFETSVGRSVTFVMVSNEPIDTDFFSHQGMRVINASGNAPEDVVTLSECDYIMGPGSTFSRWASYYGNKPLYFILDKHKMVDVKCFRTDVERSI